MGEPLDRPEEDQPPLPAEQNGQLTLWLGQAVWLWIPAQISPSWPRSTLLSVSCPSCGGTVWLGPALVRHEYAANSMGSGTVR